MQFKIIFYIKALENRVQNHRSNATSFNTRKESQDTIAVTTPTMVTEKPATNSTTTPKTEKPTTNATATPITAKPTKAKPKKTTPTKPPPPIVLPPGIPKRISLSSGKVVTTYYKRYWTGKEPLAEESGRTPRTLTPFEQAGNNIMITIKTTVAFHKTRIQLLLDTWLSAVNASNMFLVTDGEDLEYEGKAKSIGM